MNRFSLIVLLFLFTRSAYSFYDWQTDDSSGDITALFRVFGQATDNPDNNIFYQDDRNQGLAAIARLLSEGQFNNRFSYEANLLQTYIPESLTSADLTRRSVERSARLGWSFSDEDFTQLAIDRINLRANWERTDLIVGRQAINLATTFYFTPNDFFAPFAAQNFFRVYKPGVDAVRAEVRLGELSQLSLMNVFGYKPDITTDTGWSKNPDSARDSQIARISTVLYDKEWALLFGRIRDTDILGGSLQGEIFNWLGIRAEGHMADPELSDKYSELSAGIEHRWESSLNIRFEYFHHGMGASRVEDYAALVLTGETQYLARRYLALDISYEFSPLLNAEMLTIVNLLDHSSLVSFYAVYSLSNEAEMAINLGLPTGEKPVGSTINSEFGFYPQSLNIEFRSYF